MPLVFVLVAIALGVAAGALTFVRSKPAPIVGGIALLLGLAIEVQGIRATLGDLASAERAKREPGWDSAQLASSRHYAMFCAYKGAGYGAIPLAGGLVAIVIALQRKADRGA